MPTGHGEKLTRKQEQAIAALLNAPTIQKAAGAAGVGEKTLRLWLKEPGFVAAYRAARRQVVESAVAWLQRATTAAVGTLVRSMKCGHAGTEVRAALGILEHAHRGTELIDLVERIEALEQTIVKKGK